jgi:all-trans-retinol 13,14-reductase
MKFDATVVGAGLGGLAAAATLAKKGLRVHLIEPHDKVGGFATNFRRKKYRMETGIHMLSGDYGESIGHELYEFLEIKKNIEFVKIPDFYQCHYLNPFQQDSFRMPDNLFEAVPKLIEKFPHEKNGIESYFQTMREISEQFLIFCNRRPFVSATHPFFKAVFPKFEQYWKISIGHFLDGIISDQKLKIILLANVTFYHDKPYELGLVQYMISQVSYYLGGCHYIKGGSQVFSDFLKKIIEDHAGKVSLLHKVEKIEIENEIAQRVYYRKVRGENAEMQFCESRLVIVNAAMPTTYESILSGDEAFEKQRLDKAAELKKYGLSTSSTTIFLGLKRPMIDHGCDAYLNLFIDNKKHGQDLDPYKGNLGILNYDMVDTGLCAPGVYSGEAIYMDNWQSWENLNKEQYAFQKEKTAEDVIKKIDSYYPGFKNDVEFYEVGTPRTVLRYTHNPMGSIYGFYPSAESFRLRSKGLHLLSGARDAHIKNLYFASAWSFLPGFSGALMSGYKAANEAFSNL